MIPADRLAALIDIARRHDLWIVSDEVYAELALEGPAPRPLVVAPDLRDRGDALPPSDRRDLGLPPVRGPLPHRPAGLRLVDQDEIARRQLEPSRLATCGEREAVERQVRTALEGRGLCR